MSSQGRDEATRNLELNSGEIREGRSRLQSTPPFLNIDLIGICDMKPHCPMCLNWVGPKGPRHHSGMDVGDFFKFGEFFDRALYLVNCGIGEPLLHPELLEIVQLITSKGKILGMDSNGLALTRFVADELLPFSAHLTIIFSLDAASQETYAKLRADDFDGVVENIAYFCHKRRSILSDSNKYDLFAPKTGLCFIPMKVNQHEVSDFVRLAARVGVDVVEFRSLNEVDRPVRVMRKGFVFDYQEQQLSEEELERARLTAEEEAEKWGVHFDCQYSFSPDYTYEYFLPREFRHLNIPCVHPWRLLLAYENGDTVGCSYMEHSLGNWRRVGLGRLWNSRRMRRMRKQLASGRLADECLEYRSCPIVKAELWGRGST